MIVDTPLDGELIINEGKASSGLQAFFEELERHINEFKAPDFTVTSVPDSVQNEAMIIYVSDEVGGATLAFSDGLNWRRVQDRTIIT